MSHSGWRTRMIKKCCMSSPLGTGLLAQKEKLNNYWLHRDLAPGRFSSNPFGGAKRNLVHFSYETSITDPVAPEKIFGSKWYPARIEFQTTSTSRSIRKSFNRFQFCARRWFLLVPFFIQKAITTNSPFQTSFLKSFAWRNKPPQHSIFFKE